MNKEIEKGHIGDSFDNFLKEQGTYKETTAQAISRVIEHQHTTTIESSKNPKKSLTPSQR